MRITLLLLLAFCISTGFCQEKNPSNYNFNSRQQPSQPRLEAKNDTLSVVTDSVVTPQQRNLSDFYTVTGNLDSLKQEILKLRQDVSLLRTDLGNVQDNLSLSHKKFRVGTLLLGAGLAGFFIGNISANNHTGYANQLETLLILGGLGSTVTGVVFMINSHKYIGKAGLTIRRYARQPRVQMQ